MIDYTRLNQAISKITFQALMVKPSPTILAHVSAHNFAICKLHSRLQAEAFTTCVFLKATSVLKAIALAAFEVV